MKQNNMDKTMNEQLDAAIDQVIDLRAENTRLLHVAQELLDGISGLANIAQPFEMRIRMGASSSEKRTLDGFLTMLEQVQKRAAILVEGLDASEEQPEPEYRPDSE